MIALCHLLKYNFYGFENEKKYLNYALMKYILKIMDVGKEIIIQGEKASIELWMPLSTGMGFFRVALSVINSSANEWILTYSEAQHVLQVI